MPQSQITAFPRKQKEKWGTSNDKTKTRYDTTDAQMKKCNRTLTQSLKTSDRKDCKMSVKKDTVYGEDFFKFALHLYTAKILRPLSATI